MHYIYTFNDYITLSEPGNEREEIAWSNNKAASLADPALTSF